MTELILGFIPLLDCASLVVARELGFAEAEGLELTLIRESSWANIRDRLIVGHFDAAHLLGPMTVASTLGLGHIAVPLVAPFALGLGGNAVTLSTALRAEMDKQGSDESAAPGDVAPGHVAPEGAAPCSADGWGRRALGEGEALRRVVASRALVGLEPLTFGMVYPFSCHNYELRYWLAAAGIDPDSDVRLVVIPPALLVDSMRAGHLDGFCVGEPWNSVAVEAGVGSIAFPMTAVWRRSPEKVLGCREDWAAGHPEELAALLRSLYRACEWCASPANHAELSRLLAEPRHVDAPSELLHRGLAGHLQLSQQGPDCAIGDFHVPLADAATFPWVSHALWFYSQMVRWGQTNWSEAGLALARRTYRPDLYRAALAPFDLDLPLADERVEGATSHSIIVPSSKGGLSLDASGFVDGRIFDPSDLQSSIARLSPRSDH